MKFPSLKSLGNAAAATIKRFPAEILFALCGTAAAFILAKNFFRFDAGYDTRLARALMAANLGLLLSLSATLFTESRPKLSSTQKLLIRLAAVAIAIVLYFLLDPYARAHDTHRFFLLSFSMHLLVAFAAFTGCGGVNGFWQFNKALFLRFLAAFLYTMVLYLGLCAALYSLETLFNVKMPDATYLRLFVCLAGVFNTIFFLAGVPGDFNALDADTSYPKGLKIFTQYVLIPLASIYVIILIAYEAKIAILWSLPKGWVSNLIIGYAVFGILSILLVYPIRNGEGNKWLKTYARSFYFLLVPLIVLLFLAMFARISPYGVTPYRYYLLVLGCWLLAVTIYFLVSKKQNIKLIPVSLCVLSLFASYGPQGAYSVSVLSQRGRLVALFKKHGAYKDGYLQYIGKKKIDSADLERIDGQLNFFADFDGLKSLQPLIKKDLKKVDDSILRINNHNQWALTSMNRYYLKSAQDSWIQKYLGVGNANETAFRSSESFTFTTQGGDLVAVNGYDYCISLKNNLLESKTDSLNEQIDKLHVLITRDGPKIVATVNNERITFDISDLKKRLLALRPKLKNEARGGDQYSGYSYYHVPDSLMNIAGSTSKFEVLFKIGYLQFYDNSTYSMDEISGTLLLKKK